MVNDRNATSYLYNNYFGAHCVEVNNNRPIISAAER